MQCVVYRIARALLHGTLYSKRLLQLTWTLKHLAVSVVPPTIHRIHREVSKHALSPSHALFSCNYPRIEEKTWFMYRRTTARSQLWKTTVRCVMLLLPSGCPHWTLLPMCGFFFNFMLGEFYKNLSNYSFLDCKGTEKEALRCVLIRATT